LPTSRQSKGIVVVVVAQTVGQCGIQIEIQMPCSPPSLSSSQCSTHMSIESIMDFVTSILALNKSIQGDQWRWEYMGFMKQKKMSFALPGAQEDATDN
jgi:hypothetical protein